MRSAQRHQVPVPAAATSCWMWCENDAEAVSAAVLDLLSLLLSFVHPDGAVMVVIPVVSMETVSDPS